NRDLAHEKFCRLFALIGLLYRLSDAIDNVIDQILMVRSAVQIPRKTPAPVPDTAMGVGCRKVGVVEAESCALQRIVKRHGNFRWNKQHVQRNDRDLIPAVADHHALNEYRIVHTLIPQSPQTASRHRSWMRRRDVHPGISNAESRRRRGYG